MVVRIRSSTLPLADLGPMPKTPRMITSRVTACMRGARAKGSSSGQLSRVFSGGMIPVTDRLVLDQLSWFTPARWGFAASASTVDLITLVPGPLTPKDALWKHTSSAWWLACSDNGGPPGVHEVLREC